MDLLRHGLLRASFIPPRESRELRELTRYRQTLLREHTAVANRLQKLLESGNIKLGQVASDVSGLSGRLMLQALAEGEQDARRLAELAQGKLKNKKDALRHASVGRLTQVQRWVLGELLARGRGNPCCHTTRRDPDWGGKSLSTAPTLSCRRPWGCSIVCRGSANTSRTRLSLRLGSIWRGFPPPNIWRVGRDCVQATMSRRASASGCKNMTRRSACNRAPPWLKRRGPRRGRRGRFWPPSIIDW